jgi:hypothetical protein
MRGFALGFLAACALFLAEPLVAEMIVRVKPDEGGSVSARVLLLERAVAQLQQGLHESPIAIPTAAFICSLKTPFDGTFSQSATSESAARAGALAECKAHSKSSLYCEPKSVDCGKK